MKKKILLISIIILAIAILVPMGTKAATQVSTGTIDGLDYTIYEKNGERYVEITGYNYYTSSITIMNVPETIENYPVTHIGEGAFKNNTRVTEIKLPETITTIKKDAFRQCTNLTTINIPEKVTTIEELTFWYCSNLNNINLPDSVTSIEYEAFNYCSNLKNINLPDSITSIGARAFENCTSLTQIKIPSGMAELSGSLFYGCSSLEKVEIPNSVTLISSYAFNGCTSLTKIELPTSITLIGASAFQGCTSLEEIELPNSLREITANLFNVCTSLKTIEIPNTITTIESGAFRQCESLTTIEIPGSVTTLGYDCFNGCTGLTEIKIPNSVTSLERGIFENCTNLKKVELPNNISYIYSGTFKNCTSLETIDIKNGFSIGANAFENCTSLKYIDFTKVDGIDNEAFKNCTSLEKVEALRYDIYEIGDKAFENCTNLKQVDIPYVDYIGDYAFYGCTNLISVNLKRNLSAIGTYAFEKCSKLSSINLPSDIKDIGGWAFYGCTNLLEIHIPQSAKLGVNVFAGWTENQTINIEADATPEEWIEGWDSNCNAKINYGLKRVTKIESENIRINYKIPTAIKATVTPENAYNKKLEYKSSNEEIFTIDENGIITPKSNGYANVIISSTDYSNVEIRYGVTVDFWVTEITIDKTELLFNDFEKEEEINVTSILPDYADNKNVYMTTSDWEVAWTSGNKVGANGNGECEIRFYTNNYDNPLAICKVVVDIKAKSLELEQESIIFDTENPQRIYADIQPYQTNNQKLKWESTNPEVAVVDENGLVTPVSEGKCEIIATTTDGTNLTDRCEVMVTYNESALSVETYKRYDQTTNIVEMYVFTNQKLMKIPSNWTRTDKDTVYVATYTKNGSYLEEVKDIYGNTRKVALIITEIDDKAPNITIKQTYNENTRTVKVEAKSDEVLGATKPTWNLSADKRTYSKTYNANGTYTTSFVDKYGNTCKVTFTIDQIDDEAPNITIKQTYDSNTNTVKVEAVSDEVLGETKPTWTLSKDKMIYSKIYNANGTYTTAFKDLSGNAISKTFTINDIEFRYNVEKEYNSKTNTVKISLTNQVGLQATKPTWILSADTKTYSKEYTANEIYSTQFVDTYGNSQKVSFLINEIDDIAPVLSPKITYDAETNTVTVSVTSDEILGATKPTWTLSEDKKTYSKTYNLNGTYTTKFQDVYGNEVSATFTVDKIQSKYEIVTTYDEKTKTTIVSVINNYGMQATKPTWQLSADKRVYTKVYSSSGTYTTKFVDTDGIETSLTFTI